MKDYLWFIGFKFFWYISHPQVKLLMVLRRLVKKLKKKTKRPEPQEHLLSHNVPKKIWIYWAQGWDSAPPLVGLCRDSWIVHNEGWEIVLLSENNVSEYITLDTALDKKNVPHVWKADIIRLYLLEKHGGVWADATTFCTAPLDDWLPSVMQSGFFAFDKPKTTLASWFLVADKKNLLVQKWKIYADRYWKHTSEGRRYWIFFIFEYLILINWKVKNIWHRTPYINSENAYVVQNLLKNKVVYVSRCVHYVTKEVSPVHKFNWKIDIPDDFINGLRSQLQETRKD